MNFFQERIQIVFSSATAELLFIERRIYAGQELIMSQELNSVNGSAQSAWHGNTFPAITDGSSYPHARDCINAYLPLSTLEYCPLLIVWESHLSGGNIKAAL
jgi:hypothetical protein